MAIGNCDCCDRKDVSVSNLVAFGIDTTACYVCQGDVADPYGDGFDYILELLNDGDMDEDVFVRDARSIGYDDFALAQAVVDAISEEIYVSIDMNNHAWRRQFCGDSFVGGWSTSPYHTKTHAFDAALNIVAVRLGLTLPAGSGRCRAAVEPFPETNAYGA